MDKDGDGKLSPEELPERMRERFEQVDRNGDGFLDKEEQDAVAALIRQRLQGAGGDRNPQRRPDPGAGEGGSDRPRRPAADGS